MWKFFQKKTFLLLVQVSRRFRYKLERFVIFGCVHCGLTDVSGVHGWDAHFLLRGEGPEGNVLSCQKARLPEGNEKNENVIEATNGGEHVIVMKEEEANNPRDIRTMRCKLCHHQEDGKKFLPMQVWSKRLYVICT